MNIKHLLFFVRVILAFGLAVLFAACSDDPPAQPPAPPVQDTTSHDWLFTTYHITSRSLRDVGALATDYVIVVGDAVRGSKAMTNAYLWNGSALEEMSIPIKAGGTGDTCTTCTPGLFTRPNTLPGIWVLRRDHYWVCDPNVIGHVTISPNPRNDTNVFHSYWHAEGDPTARFIWGADSANVFFLDNFGKAVFRWHPEAPNWSRHQFTFHPTQNDNIARDLWGSGKNNVYAFTDHGTERFDGDQWRVFWDHSMPSLCDSVKFGVPTSCWAATDEDSMWVTGLFIGRMLKDGSGRVTYRFDGDSEQYGYAGVSSVRGSSESNVFFCGWDGYLAHYNGRTLRVFDDFRQQGIELYRLAVFEKDVFIIGAQHFGGGILIHGRRR
jgi:hypothetical protein